MVIPIIAANWKMHKTIGEAVGFSQHLLAECADCDDRIVIIAPPYTALPAVAETLKGSTFHLAGQNLSDQESGAFTGEVSATMLVDAGCEYVIIGHSERRHLFGEKNGQINQKIRMALTSGLKPIFCIGETEEERDSELAFSVIEQQLKEGLINISRNDIRSIVIAYEPVWAIGTGKTATSGQAEEIHRFIRDTISQRFGAVTGRAMAIIYGGSVNQKNIASLMAEADIDGVLVGGASLDVESFRDIIRF